MDYTGDMEFFQGQLTVAGISKDEVDMEDFRGLTRNELQAVVYMEIAKRGK